MAIKNKNNENKFQISALYTEFQKRVQTTGSPFHQAYRFHKFKNLNELSKFDVSFFPFKE